MKKRFFPFILKKAIFIMASFILFSCEKNSGELGLDQVISKRPELGVAKSFPVTSFHYLYDSLNSGLRNVHLFGAYSDPVFGEVNAQTAMQLHLRRVNPTFGQDPVVDSVVLTLKLENSYGDTTKATNYSVYMAEEDLTQTYMLNHDFAEGEFLGSVEVAPRPRSNTSLGNTNVQGLLRIPLDANFFQQKIVDEVQTNSAPFASNSNFVNYFKGIVLKSKGKSGAILYTNVRSVDFSKITIYYRNNTDNSFIELAASSVSISSPTRSLSTYQLDYTNAEFDIENTDMVNGEYTNYIQSLGGVGMGILIPDLTTLKDTVLINRAELEVPVRLGSIASSGTRYNPPPLLFMYEERDGILRRIKDYGPGDAQTENVGGSILRQEMRQRLYRFNITEQLHKMIYYNEHINPLVIFPSGIDVQASRVVVNGNLDPSNPVTLKIYYTKINP